MNVEMTWSPTSWHSLPIRQQPEYADPDAAAQTLATVKELPPLVSHGEIDTLRRHLALAAAGKAFVLQGGDCAERFADCSRSQIESKLKSDLPKIPDLSPA